MPDAFPNSEQTGLTKKEYFAVRVLESLIVKDHISNPQPPQSLAKKAVELAEALESELAS